MQHGKYSSHLLKRPQWGHCCNICKNGAWRHNIWRMRIRKGLWRPWDPSNVEITSECSPTRQILSALRLSFVQGMPFLAVENLHNTWEASCLSRKSTILMSLPITARKVHVYEHNPSRNLFLSTAIATRNSSICEQAQRVGPPAMAQQSECCLFSATYQWLELIRTSTIPCFTMATHTEANGTNRMHDVDQYYSVLRPSEASQHITGWGAP